jgi:vacuolar iron transporter family protein
VRAVRSHPEVHLSQRSNWLRAAVLGANDGILSTASLVLGVAASGGSGAAIVTAGVAGLVAGALSMAAGEYVSVSSQRDTERADIRLEERELLRARRASFANSPGSTSSEAWRRPSRPR